MQCSYLKKKNVWKEEDIGLSSRVRLIFQHLPIDSIDFNNVELKARDRPWLSQRPDGTTPKHQDVWVIEPASHEFLKALL